MDLDESRCWLEVPGEQHVDDVEGLLAWRLRPQEDEVSGDVTAQTITVAMPSASKQAGEDDMLFCDAMNKVVAKLRKLTSGSGHSKTSDVDFLAGLVDAIVALLNVAIQRQFSASAARHCQDLVCLFAGPAGLCSIVERWLSEEEVEPDKLSALEARLEWLAREVLCVEDVRVGSTVSVKRDPDAVLLACRQAGIRRDNDALRLAALGKPGRVLEIDHADGTIMCRVARVGDLWFGIAGLAPAPAAKKRHLVGRASRKTALQARTLVQDKLAEVFGCLRDLLGCMVLPEVLSSWQEGLMQAALGLSRLACTTGLLCHEGSVGCDAGTLDVNVSKIWKTSLVTSARLLHELREAFRDEQFQERFHALRSKGGASFSSSVHVQTLELTSSIQFAILPKYGFEPSPRGVADMKQEMAFHACECGDPVISKLMRDIHVLLDRRDLGGLATTMHKPRFHTVGDSHSVYGWPSYVVRHHQGPVLCYNVGRIDLGQLRPSVQEGDAVCLCLGEIDCRCHVHKHCSAERSFREVIDEILARYFGHLRAQIPLLPANVTICIYSVVPPVRTQALQRSEKLTYPFEGTDEERRTYVQYFNARLRAECSRAGYMFFDVHGQYADADGFLDGELSDGNVHIQDERHIRAQMEKFFPQIAYTGVG